MAVIIASDLAKDMAGEPLFRKVSLSLERRDRMVIGGRNGAGKTTLLRILAGEEAHDGGNIVLEKNARIALHDQRPPRDQTLTLEEYALSGCTEQLALEAELAACEAKIKDDLKVTIRCIPEGGFDGAPWAASLADKGSCVVCGKPSARRVVFAKSY